MRVILKIATLIVCLFTFPLLGYGQVFDNTCPSTQASIVPLRTVNITNGHFNDTTCVDASGNLIFQALNASLSASDTFTRANGGLGANWKTTFGNPTISSNAATSTADSSAIWSDQAFVSNSQFAQVTIASFAGGALAGPVVFGSAAGATFYECVESSTTILIQRVTADARTSLTSTAITGAAGDIVRLEITSAGAMTCYRNGVSTLTITDTTFKNGSPGIYLVTSGGNNTLTNWSGGNLPVSNGSTLTVTAPTTCKMLDNIVCVDQANTQNWPGGDYGAWVMAAIQSLPVVNGYKSGEVMLAPSTSVVTQSSPVVIVSPFLSIIGPGAGALQISCTFNGNCWDIHTNPFVIWPGLTIKGFSIIGQGASNANAVGFHIGDIIGGHFEDLAVDNFRGASSSCFWFDNINGWSERNWFNGLNGGLAQASQAGCTKAFRWTVSSSVAINGSFAHNHYIADKFSAYAGQTGLSVEGGNHSATDWFFTGNNASGTTSVAFALSGLTYTGSPTPAFIDATSMNISTECTAPCTTGTLINIAATNNVFIGSGAGFRDISALLTNTINGGLFRYLNTTENSTSAQEVLILKTANGAGAAGQYNIVLQSSGLTRTINWNDPGVATTAITFSGFAVPVMNGAGTSQGNWHVVQDTATLAAGTVTVTLTGNAVFTNATSYTCIADDDTAIAATRVLQNSGSSITITGTGTDVIRYICIGN